jgi:glycosyltransferase involved in cell wall biosynthesis
MAVSAPAETTQATSPARPLQLVIYRPHANIWFRNTVGRILKRKPLPNKYAPLLDYLLDSQVELYFASHLGLPATLGGLLKRLRDGFELLLWCAVHHISLRKVGLVFTAKSLAQKDVLFLMHYGNFSYETERLADSGLCLARSLAGVDIHKVAHLTHYAYCASSGARNLAALGPALLLAENNLARNSPFFRLYFSQVAGAFHCLPYTPAARFQERKPFAHRINKMVVTGSITYKMKSPEFIDFYQVNELQPLRRKLYEQASAYAAEMDCMISDLDASRLVGGKAQQDYYRQDIVDIYNAYTMFAVPEEVCDLPAIGFVEGMACGTAYLGQVNPMYQDIGMLAGVHYIGYDGTVEDLMAQVAYYQQRPEQVARIAQAGSLFVREQFSASRVYGNLIKRLQALVHPEGSR